MPWDQASVPNCQHRTRSRKDAALPTIAQFLALPALGVSIPVADMYRWYADGRELMRRGPRRGHPSPNPLALLRMRNYRPDPVNILRQHLGSC